MTISVFVLCVFVINAVNSLGFYPYDEEVNRNELVLLEGDGSDFDISFDEVEYSEDDEENNEITMDHIVDKRSITMENGIDLNVSYSNRTADSSNDKGYGKPLFLTPLIEKGALKYARKLATVKPFIKGIKSYAGYFTVHKEFNSNLFFWFFQSAKNWRNAPVSLWLNGGPGASSLFGLFVENGPYVFEGTKVKKRLHSWHKKSNMIFIDNPVGSGYSFTDSDEGYTKNQTVIGEQLYSAIKQFFILFPHLQKNEFYITGESYAGKYVPALGYRIHKNNPTSEFQINLKGLFIGNGLTDPVNMMKYGDYIYQLGLIDKNELKVIHAAEQQIVKHVKARRWNEAAEVFGKYILGYYYYDYKPYFRNVTGFKQHYNYLQVDSEETFYSRFINSKLFRRSVHVGKAPLATGKKAALNLKEDLLKSVINWVVELLDHYRVVFYNGQVDIICAYPLTANFLAKMKWKGAGEYRKSPRYIWKVGDKVAGYYKTVGNLTEVLVRNAGHLVPTDQPLWGRVLYESFIFNLPLS